MIAHEQRGHSKKFVKAAKIHHQKRRAWQKSMLNLQIFPLLPSSPGSLIAKTTQRGILEGGEYLQKLTAAGTHPYFASITSGQLEGS